MLRVPRIHRSCVRAERTDMTITHSIPTHRGLDLHPRRGPQVQNGRVPPALPQLRPRACSARPPDTRLARHIGRPDGGPRGSLGPRSPAAAAAAPCGYCVNHDGEHRAPQTARAATTQGRFIPRKAILAQATLCGPGTQGRPHSLTQERGAAAAGNGQKPLVAAGERRPAPRQAGGGEEVGGQVKREGERPNACMASSRHGRNRGQSESAGPGDSDESFCWPPSRAGRGRSQAMSPSATCAGTL